MDSSPRDLELIEAEAMTTSVDVLLCCFLLITAMLIAYMTKKFQFVYLPESASAMLLGMAFGVVSVIFFGGRNLRFDPQVFFYGLLPIIIFNAGYSLKSKEFFRNLKSILLFAVVGTVASSLLYGLCTYFLHLAGFITHMNPDYPLLESMMFGSLISAIDPVATLSVMQVQFGAISILSVVLGFGVSLLCALVLKYIDIKSENAKFELAFVLLSAYVSYAFAESCGLSGIMSLFFCGICNARYGYYNASPTSQISSKYAFESLAFLAEVFVFAYLGMQVVFLQHDLDAGLLLSAIPLCLVSRAVNIFPLAWLANKQRRSPISNKMKVMMWTCGLRGAIAYALAVNMPSGNRAIETTTLFIVLCTTLVFGCSTGPLLKTLGLNSETPAGHLPLSKGAGRDNIDDSGSRSVPHQIFKWVDQAYIKPVFGGQIEDLDEGSTEGNLSPRESFGDYIVRSNEDFRAPEDVPLFSLPSPSSKVKLEKFPEPKGQG